MARSHPTPDGHSAGSRGAAERPGGGQRKPPPDREGGETAAAGFSATARPVRSFPLAAVAGRPILGSGVVRPETPLQPSPEQRALVDARRADPAGSLRVLAFAGSGKTTALRLLAAADSSPALYLAYNKSAQLEAQRRFPAHVACRTVHSLAHRATGMAGQRHRLERRLAAREVAELLAVPALDGLRPRGNARDQPAI